MLQDKKLFEPITCKVVKTPIEIFLGAIKYCVDYSFPLIAASYLLKLINGIFDEKILPDSRNHLRKIFDPKHKTEYHATCPSCSYYVGE